MKILILSVASLVLIAGSVLAADMRGNGPAYQPVTMIGTVVDNHPCANANKANLPAFVKTHTKGMPICEQSGYSLYTPDGVLHSFTKDSNAKVADFLRKDDSRLDVEVVVNSIGDKLDLISITNQIKNQS